jgi:hypothetical protein
MKRSLALSALMVVMLAGCSATLAPGHARVDTSGVTISTDHDGHQGKFCPPGQAKKGRC